MKNIELINASAGSGKTYSLTTRILDQIKCGVAPESLMVTTFTNRAASELHERIRRHLLSESLADEANRVGGGYIGTVNSICARLLKEYAIEAGMSPAVEIMPEEDSEIIFKISIDRVISLYSAGMEPAARRLELDGNGSGYQENGDWRTDVKRIVDLARSNLMSPEDINEFADASWKSLSALFGEPLKADPDNGLLAAIAKSIEDLNNLGSTRETTKKALVALESSLERMQKSRLTWSDWVRLSKLKPAKDGLDFVSPVNAIADCVLRHPKFHEDVKQIILGVFGCAGEALRDYDQYKKDHGLMDFIDQETRVLDMALNNKAFQASLRNRIQMLMVDEFQDTSPVQLALFLALNELAGKSVWVGDPKQAIYSFRGTDPQLMNDIVTLIENPGILDHSWRSRKNLLEFTNTLFVEAFHEMSSDKVTLKIPLAREARAEGGYREAWHLDAKNISEEALSIANGIRDLINRMPNLNPGDIAVLCRKNDACKQIAACLEALGVRASVGHGLLMETRECRLAIAALRYMNHRGDTIALAEIIHLTSSNAAWYAELMSNPEHAKDVWHSTKIANSLNQAKASIMYWTPLEALEQAIDRINLLDMLKTWSNPELARSNLDALKGACQKYVSLCSSRRRAATVDGFVNFLDESELEQAEGTGTRTVNVLTYHGAKGLEWPWVVLTGLDAKPHENLFGASIETAKIFNPAKPLADRKIRYWPWPFGAQKSYDPLDACIDELSLKRLVRDKAEQEEKRLLYVGLTRAKDGIALAFRNSGSSLKSAWFDILKDSNGNQIVALSADQSDKHIQVGNMQIPFDMHSYGADSTSLPPLASEEIEYFPRYPGTIKSYPAGRVSPSELPCKQDAGENCDFKVIEDFGKRIKLAGSPEMDKLGNAVHAYLAVDLECLSPEGQIVLAQNTLKNWGVETAMDATDLVSAGQRLSAFIGKRYANYESCREWPISMRSADGQVIQGFIDLLLVSTEGYVIIDHKDFPGKDVLRKMKRHVPQLQMYKEIVEKATGKPVIDLLVHLPIKGLVLKVCQ